MAARICVVVTATLLHFADVSSPPPKPSNVKVVSFNMGAVLKWDIPEDSPSGVTYTVQMRGLDDFQTVCNHTGERQCDVGAVPSCLGAFDLRVRAELGARTSDWAETLHIPARETIIGPPTVEVEFKAEEVEVAITDPVLRVRTPLTKCYSRVTYVLKYWRSDQPDHVLEKRDVTVNRLRLKLIDAGKGYCVQACVHIPPYKLDGLFSEPICDQSGGGNEPSGHRAVSLALGSLALPLLMLLAWFLYKGIRFLNPKTNLPPLFKKHLSQVNAIPVNFAGLRATALPKEQSDKISLFYEEHSICEVVVKQGKPCDDAGNDDDDDGGDELMHYCNVLTLSHSSYRNISGGDWAIVS